MERDNNNNDNNNNDNNGSNNNNDNNNNHNNNHHNNNNDNNNNDNNGSNNKGTDTCNAHNSHPATYTIVNQRQEGTAAENRKKETHIPDTRAKRTDARPHGGNIAR
jgi:hypothetical protein